MAQKTAYVQTDEHGVMRVADSRVMLDSIVAAFWQGHSPETIQQQYPALTLEEIYGAIAYYLANRDDVNEYLRGQDAVWQEWRDRTEQNTGAVVERLRRIKEADVPETS